MVNTLVDVAGFGPFCSGLIQMRVESLVYGALLTLTPYDFAMLTGLRVGVGSPIPCDPDMTQWRYDWGGASLAILYCYVSFVSGRKADSLDGY
ncbi:hypothetical protein CsSME_00038278 [Camellia sinensis var. sinensis]